MLTVLILKIINKFKIKLEQFEYSSYIQVEQRGKNIIMKEIWKNIKERSLYEVSNYGRFRSWCKPGIGIGRANKPKYINGSINNKGYIIVKFYVDGRYLYKSLHRLVVEYFLPNPENKPCINHIDGDKKNNHINNIEWVTDSENKYHAYNNDLYSINGRKGESHHNAKLSINDVLDIRNAYKLNCFTQKEIANAYSMSITQISSIIRKNSWNHI